MAELQRHFAQYDLDFATASEDSDSDGDWLVPSDTCDYSDAENGGANGGDPRRAANSGGVGR